MTFEINTRPLLIQTSEPRRQATASTVAHGHGRHSIGDSSFDEGRQFKTSRPLWKPASLILRPGGYD